MTANSKAKTGWGPRAGVIRPGSDPSKYMNIGKIDLALFLSSRRRHTRCYRDWSSDVCSSDLPEDLTLDLRALAAGNVRACGNNTGREEARYYGETICLTDGTVATATAGTSVPEVQ